MDDVNLLLEQCLLHALHVRNLSKNYVTSVRLSCRMYFEHCGITRLRDCTRDSIEGWLLDGRAQRDWSAATFRGRHRDVGFLFRYLLKKGKIQEDPTVGIDLPKLGQALPKALSADEAERLLATVRRMRFAFKFEAKRNVAVIALMLFTGLRKAEVTHLKVEDVDFGRMAIHVIQGKGKKDRIVPISTRLAAILNEYVDDRERLGKSCDHFFVTTQGNTPMAITCVNRLVRKLKDRTGIQFSAHGLRHTFATLMLEGGCDLYTLSRMMGHSKIATTTVYLSCTPKMMASSIERHPLN